MSFNYYEINVEKHVEEKNLMTWNDFSACLYDPVIKIWNNTDDFRRCISRDLRYLANNKSFLSHELPCLRILFVRS